MSEASPPLANHLLAASPSHARERLFPHLELTSLTPGNVLYESGDTLHHAYFPIDCIFSLRCAMQNGVSCEISVIGNEGVLGVTLFMVGDSAPNRVLVRNAGWAYRLPAKVLKDEFHRDGELRHLLLRYTQSLITQMAQTAVCNRYHSVEQQLCRWLLLSLDRLPSNELIITQGMIAHLLGVRRVGVTEAAGKLQKKGVIEYRCGHIRVLARHALEKLSCECYAVVKKETERLLPFMSLSSQVLPSGYSQHRRRG